MTREEREALRRRVEISPEIVGEEAHQLLDTCDALERDRDHRSDVILRAALAFGDDRTPWEGGLAERITAVLARCEALERERDEATDCLAECEQQRDEARAECTRLRAVLETVAADALREENPDG